MFRMHATNGFADTTVRKNDKIVVFWSARERVLN